MAPLPPTLQHIKYLLFETSYPGWLVNTMIVAVALLTMLSLVGLATSDGEAGATFGTLAATGIGALAGAVAGRFSGKDK